MGVGLGPGAARGWDGMGWRERSSAGAKEEIGTPRPRALLVDGAAATSNSRAPTAENSHFHPYSLYFREFTAEQRGTPRPGHS